MKFVGYALNILMAFGLLGVPQAHAELLRHGIDATLHVHEGGHGFRGDLAPMIDAFTRRVLGV